MTGVHVPPPPHSSVADCEHPSIPVDSFTERIAMLRNDNGAGLEDEYAVSGGGLGRREGALGGGRTGHVERIVRQNRRRKGGGGGRG